MQAVRARGGRVGPTRLRMIELLAESDQPMSCEELAGHLPGVHASTVYRTLSQLEQWGLARHSHIGGRTAAYALGDADSLPRHVVCQDCGRVYQVSAELLWPLERCLQEELDFAIDLVHFSIAGLCSSCQSGSTRSYAKNVTVGNDRLLRR